jgi:hypothetical protein
MKTWEAFVFYHACGFPLGIGILYYIPLNSGWEFSPNNRGLVSGLIIARFGFGAFIFGFITTAIVNPDNVKVIDPKSKDPNAGYYPKEVADRVP